MTTEDRTRGQRVNADERFQILFKELMAAGQELDADGVVDVARATKDFTGAELAAIVPDAMFTAFADGERRVTAEDLLVAAQGVVPLAETAKERLTDLRQWAKGRARDAAAAEAAQSAGTGRALDL